ncbi:MAG: hypothetical protein HEQ35_00335 [Gloeotrichia echinulata IR180]|jgi:hypothetical protein
MSVKWKFFLILILSIFATSGAGVYMIQRQPSAAIVESNTGELQHLEVSQQSQETVADPERSLYQTIPLESLASALQGSDPATLAMNAFDGIAAVGGSRKVQVVYPQRNQALVTITQIPRTDKDSAIKYRVEMTTFGRSLLVSSPPVWQIVWAGSQVKCQTGSRENRLTQKCQ